MGRTRTFIAVALSPSVRQRASELTERFQTSGARVSWVVPENMHITLKFLGEQSDNDLAIICRTVTEAVRELGPFRFCCHGAGAFPGSRRPRTIWIGVREGAEALQRLQQRVDDALAEQDYPRETRAYRPPLDRVYVARAFTCYQMAALLDNTIPDTTPKLVMDLLGTFYDENIALVERQRLLHQILLQLARLARLAPVFVSAEVEDEPLFSALEERVDHLWRFEVPEAAAQPRLF